MGGGRGGGGAGHPDPEIGEGGDSVWSTNRGGGDLLLV